jgi:3-hydroxyisobutyrate dehydrogenase-like beta-hydroxyacid dehydrogenase
VETRTIGIIGIGQLGLPIATNLVGAALRVVGFDRSDRARAVFVERGGTALQSAAEVTKQADVVLLSLPSEAAQVEVLEAPTGVLAALKPGQVIIELGTYKRAFKLAQAKRIGERGGRVLEAEVSGSPPMIAERKAALFLGGPAELIAECKPLLEAITSAHFHIGEFGSAVAMKLIANYLLAIHTLAAGEALNIGVRAGFDPQRVVEIIRQSAGGSVMFSIRAPMMAARTFTPAPGPFVTLEKYLDMAATPLFSAATPYFRRAIELGLGAEDISAVVKLIEADSRQSPTR